MGAASLQSSCCPLVGRQLVAREVFDELCSSVGRRYVVIWHLDVQKFIYTLRGGFGDWSNEGDYFCRYLDTGFLDPVNRDHSFHLVVELATECYECVSAHVFAAGNLGKCLNEPRVGIHSFISGVIVAAKLIGEL